MSTSRRDPLRPPGPLALAAALLLCSQALAQSTAQIPGFDLERLELNMGRGTVLVGNGELLAPGGLSLTVAGHYQRLPLEIDDGDQTLDLVKDRATAVLSASYGVLRWLELDAQVPFVLWQQGDDPTQVGLAPLAGQGLGAPVLQARLGLLSRNLRDPVDLAADVGVGLPLGSRPALAGDAGWRFHGRLTVGTSMGWLRPSLEAGVLFRPVIPLATSTSNPRVGATSEIHLGAALVTTGDGLKGELDLKAMLDPSASQASMEVMAGVRIPLLVGLEAFLLGGPGIGNALGTPRFRVLLGVNFLQEPPPSIQYLEAAADQQLQFARTAPKPAEEREARPTQPWDMVTLTQGTPSEEALGAREKMRPYQPGPGEKLVLRDQILFGQGSAALPDLVPQLDQLLLKLQEQPNATVVIEGHSYAEATSSSDMVLALQRAQAVRSYLIAQGVAGARLRLRGLGSDFPLNSNPTSEAEKRLNRRVEVLVLSKDEPLTTGKMPP